MALPLPAIINERLLQFIWQFQYYNRSELETTNGEALTIQHPGTFNTNQGPDFLHAAVTINKTKLAGNIELHIMASDWNAHQHNKDANYNNVILHVVWLHDTYVTNTSGQIIPSLELQSLVPVTMLERYVELMRSQGFVPCENQLPVLSDIRWSSWFERLIAERLQRRSQLIYEQLHQSGNHWEEVFWWQLCKSFGTNTNTSIFEMIAKSVPVNVLAKNKNQLQHLEALLLGQAGLLQDDFIEDYPKLLKREYNFLKKKYNLTPLNVQPAFLRMRPANFPTIRLTQLAMLVYKSNHLFSVIKEQQTAQQIQQLFDVTANDYWHYHYRFDEAGDYKPKNLGKQMIDSIIINTVVPVLFAYGSYTKQQLYKDKAIEWLIQLAPEQNRITIEWKRHGVSNYNALQSQALLELKKFYCDVRRCLDCALGNKLLKIIPGDAEISSA